MKYIKFLFLSLAAIVAMSCEPDQSDIELGIQRFPDAAFYEGQSIKCVGDDQVPFLAHIEMRRRDDGLYNFSIFDTNADVQHDTQCVSFYKLHGVLADGTLSIKGDNVLGAINADQFTFLNLDVEFTKDKATIYIQFDDNKSWHCEADAIIPKLE